MGRRRGERAKTGRPEDEKTQVPEESAEPLPVARTGVVSVERHRDIERWLRVYVDTEPDD